MSVVVTAEFHNPSVLNPDFLAAHEIVPASWTAAETLTTPPLSIVKYDNGVSLTVDQSRLAVAEDTEPRFGGSYRVHDIGHAYLRTLPHVPYRSLGLNCRVSALQADPGQWLVDRFAAQWLRNEPTLKGMRPKFTLLADEALCHITLLDGVENGKPAIVAECNVHHSAPLNVEAMCAAIGLPRFLAPKATGSDAVLTAR